MKRTICSAFEKVLTEEKEVSTKRSEG